MSGRKFWENFQRLQIERRRLLDETLFTLDVGQVVQRIRVIGTQSENVISFLEKASNETKERNNGKSLAAV